MKIGKLSNEDLEKHIFNNINYKREEVLVGSSIGEDSSLIDLDELCLISTDPITGAIKDIGKLAVNISCNDIAAAGGEPVAILLTLLLPEDTDLKDVKTIMEDASFEARKLKVEIAGGHTEITDAVNKIVISTTAIGKIKKENILQRSAIKEGYKVGVTKSIGLEGTSILLSDGEEYFLDKLKRADINKGKGFKNSISVLKEGEILSQAGVNYMHDITEGGVLGAVWEASQAIGHCLSIESSKIPIDDITKEISDILNINPLKLISSGSMLFIIEEKKLTNLENKLKNAGIKMSIIGEVKGEKNYLDKDEIDSPDVDELYRGLEIVLQKSN